MPQILSDPNETLGGVPNDTTIAKKFLGEAAALRNGLMFARQKRKVLVNKSFWVNDVVQPQRIRRSVGLSLGKLREVLRFGRTKRANRVLPLPISSKSILQSLVPVMPPVKRSKWSDPDVRYEKYLDSEHNRTFEDRSLEFLMYEPNGGWEFARPHLERFTEEDKGSMNMRQLLKIVEKNSDNWNIPYFNFVPKRKDIRNQYVNPDSYSGFWTSHFFGNTKRESVAPSNLIAERLHDLVGTRFRVDTSLKTIGGREKVAKYSQLGEVTTTRAVMQEECCITQLKQNWARNITRAYKALNSVKVQSHGIGLDLLGRGWTLFKEYVLDFGGKVLIGDVISSDSSVREDVLLLAFSILRASYPDKKVVDRFFFFFTSGHVYKRVVVQGGFVYCIIGGIQSGCPFTSHLNTIATRILLLSIIERLNIKVNGLITYGDDWMVFLKNSRLSIKEFVDASYELLGVKLKDVSLGSFDNGSYETNELTLLKTGSFNGLPGRPFKEVVKKLRYSGEYSRKSVTHLFEVVSNMYMYSFGNFRAAQHISEYIKFVHGYKSLVGDYRVEKMNRIAMRVHMQNKFKHGEYYFNTHEYNSTDRYYADHTIYNDHVGTTFIFQNYIINVILGRMR